MVCVGQVGAMGRIDPASEVNSRLGQDSAQGASAGTTTVKNRKRRRERFGIEVFPLVLVRVLVVVFVLRFGKENNTFGRKLDQPSLRD
ncbi:MAG: hypothetical protein JO279_08965 [Verrucomicrobia bacterium]|nr:hypothetical protein [Verrucomicrobiota bacterium]